MLAEIHIQNYAVIENLSLELHPGLNLLSGETGSGKSIVVDALALALGGRASPDVIRSGAERATVTAVFTSEGCAPWCDWSESYRSGEGGELILRREIQTSGKSRLLVNDQPVTLTAVKELAKRLVEVHGQNEQAALFSHDAQRNLLDQFAGLEKPAAGVAEHFERRRQLEREIEHLNRSDQERLRSMDLLKFQLQELEAARLEPGEDAALEAERQVLANLEKVRQAAATAYSELYEEEGSAASRLAAVRHALEELRRYDAHAAPHLESLASASAALEDLAFFLRDYLGKQQADPGRLEAVADRLALIGHLKRKYGATIEETLRYREEARHQLSNLEYADERRVEVERELEGAAADYDRAAEDLSQARRAAARRLERKVREELAQVGMEKTRFQVRLTRPSERDAREAEAAEGPLNTGNSEPETRDSAAGREAGRLPSPNSVIRFPAPQSVLGNPGGPHGIDDVEFLIAPNPGEEGRPLERIASGGELSRLMLALKTVVGQARLAARGETGGSRSESPVPDSRSPAATFVFDEVDSGIGGRVAESVGRRLRCLARGAQVICVTHLAQIACFAEHHYYVEKFERDGRAVTEVKYLRSSSERASELARMLSGSRITEAVRKHAAAMLKQAADSGPGLS